MANTPQSRRRWLPLWARVLLILVAVVTCGLVAYFGFITWYLFSGSGPAHAQQPPPPQFEQTLLAAGVERSAAKYANLGGFIDNEYAWRVPVSSSELAGVIAALGVTAIPSTAVPASALRTFPWTWRPRARNDTQFYSSEAFPFEGRGQDGYHVLAVYDSRDGQLYVWLKADF